jgi:hypothetical protein
MRASGQNGPPPDAADVTPARRLAVVHGAPFLVWDIARSRYTPSVHYARLDGAHKLGQSRSHSCVSWASSPQIIVKTDEVMLCPDAAGAPDGNLDLRDGRRRKRAAVASVPVR